MIKKTMFLLFLASLGGCTPTAQQNMDSRQAIFRGQACIQEQAKTTQIFYGDSHLAFLDGVIECGHVYKTAATDYKLNESDKSALYVHSRMSEKFEKFKSDARSRVINNRQLLKYNGVKTQAVSQEESVPLSRHQLDIMEAELVAFEICSSGAKSLAGEAQKKAIEQCAYSTMPVYLWANPPMEGESPDLTARSDYLPQRRTILIKYMQKMLNE